MKTSELIALMTAVDSSPVSPISPGRRLAMAGLLGVIVALAALALTLGLQPLAAAAHASWFWMKAGYSLSMAVCGLLLLRRLARPGAAPGWAAIIIGVLALAAMAMMAAHASMRAPADHRGALWLGQTWRMCSWRIVLLAIPTFAALIFALRRLAPTRLALAGAAAGLLAGGLSAAVYGLYCRESAAPFVVAWYSLGMAACAFVGALLGPRLLRW
ncbi:MAG TPA: DUF1109 domain-containing protein [Caulobacteraceae bacterium]|jgi:hypothetical protein|nr:DUF1109 domain-containing protein [Caulobacteraceae bacterium]